MRISDWSSDVCSSDLVHDDARPARRAKREYGLAVRPQNDGWRHGAARPLSRLTAVGDGQAAAHGHEAEIGQLGVHVKAVRHQATDEQAFERRGWTGR